MQATIEDHYTTPDGGSNNIIPPTYTAERNGDGEGDGRQVEAGIKRAEEYANRSTIIELGGVAVAEASYSTGRRSELQRQFSIPTGRLAVRREMPIFLN